MPQIQRLKVSAKFLMGPVYQWALRALCDRRPSRHRWRALADQRRAREAQEPRRRLAASSGGTEPSALALLY